jgi:hypothetical protein
MHLMSSLQAPTVDRTSTSSFIRQHAVKMLPTVKACDKLNELEAGDISFLSDGSAKIVLPLLQTESGRAQELQDTAHCFQLLGQLNAKFLLSLTTGTAEPKCTFDICKEHVEKLPLFLDLINSTSQDPAGSSKQRSAKKVSSSGRKKRCVSATADVVKVPFEPPQPASASGLACVLMLLEEAASPMQLFRASCGPRLAIQCLSVRPSL